MNLLSKEVEKEIEKIVEEYSKRLSKEEVSEIIKQLIPDLDILISKIVIKHFREIAEYILVKFKEKE